MAGKVTSVTIDTTMLPNAVEVLSRTLKMDRAVIGRILGNDGIVERDELFGEWEDQRAIPSPAFFPAHPAKSEFGRKFFEANGIGLPYFQSYYDETFGKVVSESDTTIDTIDELQRLELLINGFLQREAPMNGNVQDRFRMAIERSATIPFSTPAGECPQTGAVVKSCYAVNGRDVSVRFEHVVPETVETLGRLFFEGLTTEIPTAVKFMQNVQVLSPKLTDDQKKDPDIMRILPKGGYVFYMEINIPYFFNAYTYLHVTRPITPGGAVVLEMRQLTDDQKELFTGPENTGFFSFGMSDVRGNIGLRSDQSGKTRFDVELSARLPKVISALTPGGIKEKIATNLSGALQAIARFVARKFWEECVKSYNHRCAVG